MITLHCLVLESRSLGKWLAGTAHDALAFPRSGSVWLGLSLVLVYSISTTKAARFRPTSHTYHLSTRLDLSENMNGHAEFSGNTESSMAQSTVNGTHAGNGHAVGCGATNVEPIAIIGMSLKFPGKAVDCDSFWKMLLERHCASTDYPKDRMNIDAFYHPDPKMQNKARHQCTTTSFRNAIADNGKDMYSSSSLLRGRRSRFRRTLFLLSSVRGRYIGPTAAWLDGNYLPRPRER